MTDEPAGTAPVAERRRPRLLIAAMIAAALLLVAGVLVAVVGYRETSGPDGAVRGYFDALQRGDASDALAFGDLPDESTVLLTSRVLREQNRIAAIAGVRITGVRETGERARVSVRYAVRFPGGDRPVSTHVPVHKVDGEWRLVRAAVPTELQVTQASERATVLGHRIPTGTVLVFPGAVPIGFDTAYLQLVPSRSTVSFDSGATTQVSVEPSSSGRRAAVAATTAALRDCLTAGADPTCPQPTERYIPGSVRGDVIGRPALRVEVGDGEPGTLEVSGRVSVRGRYSVLGFDNELVSRRRDFDLPVRARGYAVVPLRTTWLRPT